MNLPDRAQSATNPLRSPQYTRPNHLVPIRQAGYNAGFTTVRARPSPRRGRRLECKGSRDGCVRDQEDAMMSSVSCWMGRAMAVVIIVLLAAGAVFAQTTGTVVGAVKDSQGAVIPGATVTLVSETRGTSLETQTTQAGAFEFTNITADTYTVRITLTGFKITERKGVSVSPGDRVVIGSLTIEVGS